MDMLFGINPTAEILGSDSNILLSEYLTSEWGLPPGQVVLAGDGHWWITLDYRNGGTPSVTWLDTEVGQDIPIAETFAAFFAGLQPIEDFE